MLHANATATATAPSHLPPQKWNIGVSIVFGILAVVCVGYMYSLPELEVPTSFKCPLVPLVPCLGIAINMSMMTGACMCVCGCVCVCGMWGDLGVGRWAWGHRSRCLAARASFLRGLPSGWGWVWAAAPPPHAAFFRTW